MAGTRLPAIVGSVQDVPEYSLDVVGRGPVRVVLLEAPRVADPPLMIAGPVGFLAVGIAWLLNENAGRPVVRFAVAPASAIVVVLAANLWEVVT